MGQTLGSIFKEIHEGFVHAALPEATAQAQWLIAQLGSFNRFDYVLHPEKLVSNELATSMKQAASQILEGMPLEYILGKVSFDGHELEVGPGVLIPRPETEELVHYIADRWKHRLKEGSRLLDLGTGSGCLAIALAARFSQVEVGASDQSFQAIEIAKRNAQKSKVKIDFRVGNWIEPWVGDDNKKFDFVVSNPPYIATSEEGEMSLSTRLFEPKEALFAEEEGLAVYSYFSKNILKITEPGALVAFEIGYRQGERLCEIFKTQGWARGEVFKDLSGHDRFFFIERE